jgi:nitrate reductase gamma subunit
MHHEPSSLLAAAEVIHWVALAVMAVVYTSRLAWLFSWKATRDRSAPGAPHRTDARKGAVYSLGNVVMPWSMESTRTDPLFYLSFILFHLGVTAGIALAFLSSLAPGFVRTTPVAWIFGTLLTAAFAVGVLRMVRRLTTPHMKLISTPDDYFSLALLTVWFLLGAVTQASLAGTPALAGDGWLAAYLLLTAFFLLYVPFSKISHYLYYPFTRIWIGRALGHRGSMPLVRVRG